MGNHIMPVSRVLECDADSRASPLGRSSDRVTSRGTLFTSVRQLSPPRHHATKSRSGHRIITAAHWVPRSEPHRSSAGNPTGPRRGSDGQVSVTLARSLTKAGRNLRRFSLVPGKYCSCFN
ncbi:hypothetical protein NDU88_006482 [Pleurodeles waltl]|uniref:Uncharacterized protein n=1 Tax=Pleurodeles waltl TaxID=8319 RepID=A0AAV7ME66_PLEWA|nr:hypothetical protein NDU88_006482 [Pleurodeles waltl]